MPPFPFLSIPCSPLTSLLHSPMWWSDKAGETAVSTREHIPSPVYRHMLLVCPDPTSHTAAVPPLHPPPPSSVQD